MLGVTTEACTVRSRYMPGTEAIFANYKDRNRYWSASVANLVCSRRCATIEDMRIGHYEWPLLGGPGGDSIETGEIYVPYGLVIDISESPWGWDAATYCHPSPSDSGWGGQLVGQVPPGLPVAWTPVPGTWWNPGSFLPCGFAFSLLPGLECAPCTTADGQPITEGPDMEPQIVFVSEAGKTWCASVCSLTHNGSCISVDSMLQDGRPIFREGAEGGGRLKSISVPTGATVYAFADYPTGTCDELDIANAVAVVGPSTSTAVAGFRSFLIRNPGLPCNTKPIGADA
jgi:hypothetical protein